MKIFLPYNIKMNDVDGLGEATINKYDKRKMIRLMYAIQEICCKAHYYNDQEWTTIYSKNLQRICRNYKPYLEVLREMDILRISDYYQEGECKLYSYTPIYLKTYILHNIDRREEEYIIKERIKSRNKNKGSEFENKLNSHFAFLHFDIERASLLAYKLKEDRWAEYASSSGITKQTVISKNNYDQWQIGKWQSRYFDGSRDQSSGRFHSLLTRLPREYKQFITFKGQHIYSLDIVNSQPFFLLSLMSKSFWAKDDKLKGQSDPSSINVYTLGVNNLITDAIDRKIQKAILNLGEDYILYREKVLSGTLYEYLQDQYNLERKAAKRSFFATIFSSNHFMGQKEAELKRDFKLQFPTVYNFIRAVKTSSKCFLLQDKLKKQHSRLSIILQRLESYIVIDQLATRILKDHPNISIYTIHDNICSIEAYMPLIQQLFTETILTNTDLTPKFSMECWQKII